MKLGEKLEIVSKKDFDSEPVYNKKYLKIKIKSYKVKINTSFHNNKIPKESSQCISLSLILVIQFTEKIKNIILKCFEKNVTNC